MPTNQYNPENEIRPVHTFKELTDLRMSRGSAKEKLGQSVPGIHHSPGATDRITNSILSTKHSIQGEKAPYERPPQGQPQPFEVRARSCVCVYVCLFS